MSDPRRFHLFSRLIAENFPPGGYQNVADVAGGKGYLQLALDELGYKTITYDKRKRRVKSITFQHRYFDSRISNKFDLIVGMHPDEATDVIITEATKRGIPFVICPCCVMPSFVQYWGVHKYRDWLNHLENIATRRGYTVAKTALAMNGKNIVLIGRKNDQKA